MATTTVTTNNADEDGVAESFFIEKPQIGMNRFVNRQNTFNISANYYSYMSA